MPGAEAEPFVQCWVCHVIVSVPHDPVLGTPANYLKCGWCGAVNRYCCTADQHQQSWSAPWVSETGQTQQPGPQSPQRTSFRLCLHAMYCIWRWAVVALVLALMLSLVGTGIICLLPRICSTWGTYLPNLFIACMLTVQVLVNFAASVMQPAGSVQDFLPLLLPARGDKGEVVPGSFDNWAYCSSCQSVKPPGTHHCRTCRKCVYGLDHHCPFINNCVGRGNLRHFLLFLVWTLVSCMYMILMCSLLVRKSWDVVRDTSILPRSAAGLHVLINNSSSIGSSSSRGGSSGHDAPGQHEPSDNSSNLSAGPSQFQQGAQLYLVMMTGVLAMALQRAPWWLICTYYLITASCASFLAISVLLMSQLHYLSMNLSYVDSLKQQQQQQQQHHHSVADAIHDDKQLQQQQQHHTAVTVVHPVPSLMMPEASTAHLRGQVLWLQLRQLYGGHSNGGLLLGLLIPQWKQIQATSAKKQS